MSISRIDGIVTCSGDAYAKMFKKSINVWAGTLDRLIVVCKPEDEAVMELCSLYPNVHFVTTTLFTDYGAKFNKGAALCYAYRELDPIDWVVHFDADVTPPRDWRDVVENGRVVLREGHKPANQRVEPGIIYGVPRVFNREELAGEGRPHNNPYYAPYGYFQMWHVTDPASWRWPIFENFWPHAACYDMEFMYRWDSRNHRQFDFAVYHEGSIRENWFGHENRELFINKKKKRVGRFVPDQAHHPDVQKLIDERLDVPAPEITIEMSRFEYTGREIMRVLRAAAEHGPFAVQVSVVDGPQHDAPPTSLIIREINETHTRC